MALTNTTKLNSYMGITTDATLAGYIITWVQGWIENSYCNRIFDSATYTDEKYDGDGTSTLMLRNYPIISVTSITIDGSTLTSTNYHDPTNYASGLLYKKGIIKRIDGGVWIKGNQHIYVTYVAGYATIPLDLEGVATMMCADIYNEALVSKKGGVGPIKGEKLGQYSVTYASLNVGEIQTKYKIVLDRYRRLAG